MTPRLIRCWGEEEKEDEVMRGYGSDVGLREEGRMDAEVDEGGTENGAVAVAVGEEDDVVVAVEEEDGVGPDGSVAVGVSEDPGMEVRGAVWEAGSEGGSGIGRGDTLLDLGFTRKVTKVHTGVCFTVKGNRKRKHRVKDQVPKSIGANKNNLRKYLVPRRLISVEL